MQASFFFALFGTFFRSHSVNAIKIGVQSKKKSVPLCRNESITNFAVEIGKTNAVIAQLVEHWLPKPRVAGSSPVYRSKIKGKTSYLYP